MRNCEYQDCTAAYGDASALRKHHIQAHLNLPPINCTQCDYKIARRDRVRAHFTKQHSVIALPEQLQERGRYIPASS